MVALAVSYANPIQEHLAYVGALYAGGALGRNALPIGFALLNPPDVVIASATCDPKSHTTSELPDWRSTNELSV